MKSNNCWIQEFTENVFYETQQLRHSLKIVFTKHNSWDRAWRSFYETQELRHSFKIVYETQQLRHSLKIVLRNTTVETQLEDRLRNTTVETQLEDRFSSWNNLRHSGKLIFKTVITKKMFNKFWKHTCKKYSNPYIC